MRAVWAIAKNDFLVWLRSPATIAAGLLPPIAMGLLVALLTYSVGQQPVALVVQGEGRFAKRMARILAADTDAYMLREMGRSEAEHALASQQVAAIVSIPTNFDEGVTRGEGAVDLYLNNVDIDIADDLRRSVTRSVAEFDAPQLGRLGELHGPSEGVLLPNVYRIAVEEHDLRQTDVSFLQYQMVPVLILIVVNAGLLGTAAVTARDTVRGTALAMLLSPVATARLIGGRLLGGTLVCLAAAVPFTVACFGVFPPIALSHVAAVVCIMIALALVSSGLGVLIGTLARTEAVSVMAALNLAVYSFFLGGGFTTVAFLPDSIQRIAGFVPARYAIDGLRQCLFYPRLQGVGTDLMILLAFCLACSLGAVCRWSYIWRRS